MSGICIREVSLCVKGCSVEMSADVCLVLWVIVKLNYFCHDCALCLCAIFHVALL